MDSLRDKFWELELSALTRKEWEALCDGCGRCCLHKLEDEDTGAIVFTNVACKLLDLKTARCADYRHRKIAIPDCVRLTPKLVEEISWLPSTCAYRLRGEGKELPAWHPLISGTASTVAAAGISVAGKAISETLAGDLEHHIVDWS